MTYSNLEISVFIVFSVTYYLELHMLYILLLMYIFIYEVKMLMFYNVQTTTLTFVGKKEIYNT